MKLKADLFTVLTAVIFLIAATVIGSVLLSNKGGVNLHHRHHLDLQADAVKTTCTGYFRKTCHVVFDKEIKKTNDYNGLITLLYSLDSNDTVYLYFTGDGGYVDTALLLHAAIKQSKARTVTVITGDVFSAHALLAVSGKEVRVANDKAIVMFHRSSIYNVASPEDYCQKTYKDKTDRQQSAAEKCAKYYEMFLAQDANAVKTIYAGILTLEEIKSVLEGHDVFLTGKELKRRLQWRYHAEQQNI